MYAIHEWKGRVVTTVIPASEYLYAGTAMARQEERDAAKIIDCNQFYVTTESVGQKNAFASYPLRLVEINYDHREERLELRLLRD